MRVQEQVQVQVQDIRRCKRYRMSGGARGEGGAGGEVEGEDEGEEGKEGEEGEEFSMLHHAP